MNRLKGVGSYGTVGLDMAVSITLGFLGGRWLDNKVGGHGWITAIGFVFGVAAGFNLLFKTARRMREQVEYEDRQQGVNPNQRDEDDKRDKH